MNMNEVNKHWFDTAGMNEVNKHWFETEYERSEQTLNKQKMLLSFEKNTGYIILQCGEEYIS